MTQLTSGIGGIQPRRAVARNGAGKAETWKCWQPAPKEAFKGKESGHLGSLGSVPNTDASPCLQHGWKEQDKLHTLYSQLLNVN